MKLKNLVVENFRSIKGPISVPLDAPIVLIHGPNGSGKTSLLTALELALTGSSTALSRVDLNYQSFLLHQGQAEGKISLYVEGFSQSEAEFVISKNGVKGKAILSEAEARFFNERCYLAQSTLARLLELYETQDTRKSDSALTAFVKELLGLNQLDALVEGTKPFSRVPSLRTTLPQYEEAEKERDSLKEAIAQVRVVILDKAAAIERAEGQLVNALKHFRPELSVVLTNLDTLSAQLNLSETRKELSLVAKQLIDLRTWQGELTNAKELLSKHDDKAAELEHKNAQTALKNWNNTTGGEIARIATELKKYFSDIERIQQLRPDVVWNELYKLCKDELTRVTTTVSQSEKAALTRKNLRTFIEKGKSRLQRIDEKIASLSGHTTGIAKALTEIMPHIHGDTCPVCDSGVSIHGHVSLVQHVSEKITAIHRTATELSTFSTEKFEVMSSVEQAERELSTFASMDLPAKELNGLKIKQSEIEPLVKSLDSLRPHILSGNAIINRAANASSTISNIRSTNERSAFIRSEIEKFYHSKFDENLGSDASIEAILQQLIETTISREGALTRTMEDCAEINTAIKRLQEDKYELFLKTESVSKLEQRLVIYDEVFTTLGKLKDQVKDVSKRAQEVRTSIVRGVFNDTLNKVWSDFFIRLAPEEPFVPAFALPANDKDAVEARLETRTKAGDKGGNPRTMLSAGNLNTAALTLFLALHFSVKAQLPFLIIDDPLQSMDEVHISQFAALLRTVARQSGKQVIIAVHEKSLFDYLALELAPNSHKERLYTVELSRDAKSETIPPKFSPFSYHQDEVVKRSIG